MRSRLRQGHPLDGIEDFGREASGLYLGSSRSVARALGEPGAVDRLLRGDAVIVPLCHSSRRASSSLLVSFSPCPAFLSFPLPPIISARGSPPGPEHQTTTRLPARRWLGASSSRSTESNTNTITNSVPVYVLLCSVLLPALPSSPRLQYSASPMATLPLLPDAFLAPILDYLLGFSFRPST